MQNIQPILDKIYERVKAHKIDTGRYSRWLWQDANGSRELGVNPYGCADAANLLYMLGKFPRVTDERSEWIEAMREMQDKIEALREKNAQQAVILNNAQQTSQFAAMLAPIAQDLEKIKCKLPETATIPYSPVVGVPNCVAYQFGLYGGFPNGVNGAFF